MKMLFFILLASSYNIWAQSAGYNPCGDSMSMMDGKCIPSMKQDTKEAKTMYIGSAGYNPCGDSGSWLDGQCVYSDEAVEINKLTGCKKEDNGQQISCPDGLYIKSSAVVDSIRTTVHGKDEKNSKDNKKRVSGTAIQQ